MIVFCLFIAFVLLIESVLLCRYFKESKRSVQDKLYQDGLYHDLRESHDKLQKEYCDLQEASAKQERLQNSRYAEILSYICERYMALYKETLSSSQTEKNRIIYLLKEAGFELVEYNLENESYYSTFASGFEEDVITLFALRDRKTKEEIVHGTVYLKHE